LSMAGYTKLFNSILASSIWLSGKETKLLWITMLAMAGEDGIAHAAVPGLAHMSGLTVHEVETSLKELASPDPHSRTKDHEGRRVEEVDGGWLLLNHAKYRAKMGADERREYKRQKQAEYRKRDSRKRVDKRSTRGQSGHKEESESESESKAEATYLPRVPGTSTALGVVESAALDRLDEDIAFEERRFTALALPIRDTIQTVLDSLPRPATRAPFSAARWTRTGLTGIGRSENALTVLRLTNDALEARQRAQVAPYIGDKNRISFESIDRVLGTGEFSGKSIGGSK
jgi:hypothetical protein